MLSYQITLMSGSSDSTVDCSAFQLYFFMFCIDHRDCIGIQAINKAVMLLKYNE